MLNEASDIFFDTLAFLKRAFRHALVLFKRAFSPICRVFGKGVSKKKFQVVRTLCSQVRSFLPPKQKRNTPRNFEMKCLSETPFPNALSVRKRSVTTGVRTGYLAHVPRYVLFHLQTLKGIPLGTSTWQNAAMHNAIFSHRNSYPFFYSVIAVMLFPVFQHRP